MKLTRYLIALLVLAVAGTWFYLAIKKNTNDDNRGNLNSFISNTPINPTANTNQNTNFAPLANTAQPAEIVVPSADFFDRITKKTFGIYITPKTSPIQPEKFTGYHTGADAETTPAEADIDVPIYSIANGAVVFAGHVNGYGGVIMIQYEIGAETITALYGHLRISSFKIKNGGHVNMAQQIAVLGTGFSAETDGERKHLHFGIIKGANINYKGYVSSLSQLNAWEDPVTWLHSHGL